MRICFYCDEYPPGLYGGIGRYIQTVARALSEAGHEVRVVGYYRHLDGATREYDNGVLVERLPCPRPDKAGIRQRILAYRTIASMARRGEIDLVEIPDASGWAAMWPKLDVPVVARIHGSISFFAREAGRRAWWFDKWVEAVSLKRSDFWYSSSRYAADRTREIFSLPPPDEVIGLPVIRSGDASLPASFRSTERCDNLVVFAGTLTPKKGVKPLLEAWPSVVRSRPGARLMLCGKGDPNPWMSLLPEDCRPSVEFRGHLSQEDLQRIFQTARAGVFPSYAEAFGLAPLEAMANCCPTIYSTLTTGPELLADGRDGILVDPRRPAEIAHALEQILSDDDLAARLGDAGQRRVLSSYGTDRIVPELTSFYQTCCDRFHGRGIREPRP